jgi:hypothetical protein
MNRTRSPRWNEEILIAKVLGYFVFIGIGTVAAALAAH